MDMLTGLARIAGILLLAVALSTNRRAIRPRVVVSALLAQAVIAFLVLHVPLGRHAVGIASDGVGHLLGYARAGTDFLFGPLADPQGGGASFAIGALPAIIFFSSLISILYHFGVMQRLVRWVGGALRWVTGVLRVESLCAASNIFVGQSESPLVIRPYLAGLSRPQLFAVMASGMAGVAGTILAAYASMGVRIDYLLAASFMSAPGGLLMAKIMMPDDPGRLRDEAVAVVDAHGEDPPVNLIMAAAQGAQTGVKLAVAVGAMVLSFVALMALANGVAGAVGTALGHPGLSVQAMLGFVFKPFMMLAGISWSEAGAAGGLFGTKVVLNEFLAFLDLGRMGGQLSPRSVAIMTFALCGFANFGSIAVQMAVTGNLAPTRRGDIARLGVRAVAAGSLANLMSAALASLMLPQLL